MSFCGWFFLTVLLWNVVLCCFYLRFYFMGIYFPCFSNWRWFIRMGALQFPCFYRWINWTLIKPHIKWVTEVTFNWFSKDECNHSLSDVTKLKDVKIVYYGSGVSYKHQNAKASFACLLFVWSELVDFIWQAWPDLKQPLRLSWTETEMENGVRSNQHCCHDYVQSTPTCNQATGRAATKPMWQWQVDWKWKGGQEAWAGGWRGCSAQCRLVLSSPSHCPPCLALFTVISCCTENHRQRWDFKQKH